MRYFKTEKNRFQMNTLALIIGSLLTTPMVFADSNIGDLKVDFRLRYEMVDQDNSLKDADALTLRTTMTYKSPTLHNFSGVIEFEDSRQVLGINDYNDTIGNNTDYSVVADPETTELDQGYLQYKQAGFTAKVGRQVITLDNQRFVGAVGWRQDKQTFDAATASYKVTDKIDVSYSYISKRNRIFADKKDIDAKDSLIHASYKSSYGTLTAYGYLLEMDDMPSNSLDTYGIRFKGQTKLANNDFLYTVEFASQDNEMSGEKDRDADYMFAEVGYKFSGLTAKLGYESLGSDDAAYAFSTPLATLHAFNGWSDQFLNTPKEGLNDLYVSLAGTLYGGKWAFVYHDFEADESTDLVDDLGSEINAVYSRGIMKNISAGIKVASYSDGDSGAGKVDTDKVWLWVNAKF